MIVSYSPELSLWIIFMSLPITTKVWRLFTVYCFLSSKAWSKSTLKTVDPAGIPFWIRSSSSTLQFPHQFAFKSSPTRSFLSNAACKFSSEYSWIIQVHWVKSDFLQFKSSQCPWLLKKKNPQAKRITQIPRAAIVNFFIYVIVFIELNMQS